LAFPVADRNVESVSRIVSGDRQVFMIESGSANDARVQKCYEIWNGIDRLAAASGEHVTGTR